MVITASSSNNFNYDIKVDGNLVVKVVELTSNRKLGKVSSTYVSQGSCPSSCVFRNAGCYAELGYVGILNKKFDTAISPEKIAEAEAKGISMLTGARPLRLHVVGDCATNQSANIVSKAAEEYTKKFGMPVWTYTHGNTDKVFWRGVSVLKSCETISQIHEADKKGFASALVVSKFLSDKAYKLDNDFTGIPCPAQTRGLECATCKLCMNADKLHKLKRVILFEAHGSKKNIVKTKVN